MTQPDKAALANNEIEVVGWAILQALHEGNEDGPQSWSDLAEDQEKRIRKAAVAAIEAVTDLSQYHAQGFSMPTRSADGMREAAEFPKTIFTHPSATAEGDKAAVPIISNVRVDGMREALEEIVTLYDSGKNAATLCMTAQRALAAPQASP